MVIVTTVFIASNMAGQFIVIDALGADFQIGHQISYEGSKIINETLNDETEAKVHLESNEKKLMNIYGQ